MKFTHGQKVTCKIYGTEITDAKISIDKDGTPFICQNIESGGVADDRLGYRYSWVLRKDFIDPAVTDLKPFEKTWDTLEVGDEVKKDGNIRTVLNVSGRVIDLSWIHNPNKYLDGYTKEQLIANDWTVVTPEPEIIEVNGKKYAKDKLVERLKDLDEVK